MPRSRINNSTVDLNTDNGAVLWSIIQGEQFEFAITMQSLYDISEIDFKAVIIEGLNLVYVGDEDPDLIEIPKVMRPNGKTNLLTIRKPAPTNFDINESYAADHLVKYEGAYYKALATPTTGILPTVSESWEPYSHNRVYVQFPSTLSLDWTVQPLPTIPVYGFFELSISDRNSFAKTLKSLRGLAEFSFSPCLLVV